MSRSPKPNAPSPVPDQDWDEATPRERLSVALDVINRADLTPEAKLRLEQQLLTQYDQSTTGRRPSQSSPDSTTDSTLSNDGSPATKPGDDLSWAEYVTEISQNFLEILRVETEQLYTMAERMPPSGPHILTMETYAANLEIARIVTTRIHLDARSAESELLVPEEGLVDSDGYPLAGRHDA